MLNFSLSFNELIKITHLKINYSKWIISPITSIFLSYIFIEFFVSSTIVSPANLIILIVLFILIYVILIYIFNNVIIKKNKLEVTYAKRKF